MSDLHPVINNVNRTSLDLPLLRDQMLSHSNKMCESVCVVVVCKTNLKKMSKCVEVRLQRISSTARGGKTNYFVFESEDMREMQTHKQIIRMTSTLPSFSEAVRRRRRVDRADSDEPQRRDSLQTAGG